MSYRFADSLQAVSKPEPLKQDNKLHDPTKQQGLTASLQTRDFGSNAGP